MMTRRKFLAWSVAGTSLVLLARASASALTDFGVPGVAARRPVWLHGSARNGCAQPFPFPADPPLSYPPLHP